MKAQKRPVIVDVWKWEEWSQHPPKGVKIRQPKIFFATDTCDICGKRYPSHKEIQPLEGRMMACPGDWLIKGVEGEYYFCKPSIFEKTYEVVNE
jgi:hypothetical protein